MTEIVTLEVAKQRLAAAVEQYGADHKPVNRCMYFKKGVNGEQVPLCIVGAAFADELRAAGVSTDRWNSESAFKLAQMGVIPATELAARFLDIAQDRQDFGFTWGGAVREADEWIADRVIPADDVSPMTSTL